MFRERCKLPSGVWAEPQPKRCLGVLYAFLAILDVLVHFGGWLSGKITPEIQENITGVGKVTLHACIEIKRA